MEAVEIIAYLRENNFQVKADGQHLELSPAEKVTTALIERLKKNKPAILRELKAEERKQKVSEMLAENPTRQRVYITDTTSDPDNVILTIGIRGVATCEMLIPITKYDPFILLTTIDKELKQ